MKNNYINLNYQRPTKYLTDRDIQKIDNFLNNHNLPILDIRSQPWLGSDIYFKKQENGWEILLYPSVFTSSDAYLLILMALTSILRRIDGWFSFPDENKFSSFMDTYLSKQNHLLKSKNLLISESWGFRESCFLVFELKYSDYNGFRGGA